MAHDGPPHQDQWCLQIKLFSSLVLKELSAGDEQDEFANSIDLDEAAHDETKY